MQVRAHLGSPVVVCSAASRRVLSKGTEQTRLPTTPSLRIFQLLLNSDLALARLTSPDAGLSEPSA